MKTLHESDNVSAYAIKNKKTRNAYGGKFYVSMSADDVFDNKKECKEFLVDVINQLTTALSKL